ncbi:unnamed protein product [Camellia sinensis]
MRNSQQTFSTSQTYEKLELWDNRNLTGKTSFSGQVPDSVSNLKALNSVYLIECNFSGSIPANLYFLYNSFSGQIPVSISNLAKFTHLFLSNNNLNGQIPDSIGSMSQLAFLDLFGNQLRGPIPLYAIGLSRV